MKIIFNLIQRKQDRQEQEKGRQIKRRRYPVYYVQFIYILRAAIGYLLKRICVSKTYAI